MKNKTNNIIDSIENVRKKNNKNWMNLLRLAFKENPKETSKILSKILSKDQTLINLANKLKKITK
jgi:hypothetical protein